MSAIMKTAKRIVRQKDRNEVGAPPKYESGRMMGRVTWRLPAELIREIEADAKKRDCAVAEVARRRLERSR